MKVKDFIDLTHINTDIIFYFSDNKKLNRRFNYKTFTEALYWYGHYDITMIECMCMEGVILYVSEPKEERTKLLNGIANEIFASLANMIGGINNMLIDVQLDNDLTNLKEILEYAIEDNLFTESARETLTELIEGLSVAPLFTDIKGDHIISVRDLYVVYVGNYAFSTELKTPYIMLHERENAYGSFIHLAKIIDEKSIIHKLIDNIIKKEK